MSGQPSTNADTAAAGPSRVQLGGHLVQFGPSPDEQGPSPSSTHHIPGRSEVESSKGYDARQPATFTPYQSDWSHSILPQDGSSHSATPRHGQPQAGWQNVQMTLSPPVRPPGPPPPPPPSLQQPLQGYATASQQHRRPPSALPSQSISQHTLPHGLPPKPATFTPYIPNGRPAHQPSRPDEVPDRMWHVRPPSLPFKPATYSHSYRTESDRGTTGSSPLYKHSSERDHRDTQALASPAPPRSRSRDRSEAIFVHGGRRSRRSRSPLSRKEARCVSTEGATSSGQRLPEDAGSKGQDEKEEAPGMSRRTSRPPPRIAAVQLDNPKFHPAIAAPGVSSSTRTAQSVPARPPKEAEGRPTGVAGGDDAKTQKAKKVPVVATSKKVALNITKWNQKQEEFRNSIGAIPATDDASPAPSGSGRITKSQEEKSVERSLKTDDLLTAPLPTTDSSSRVAKPSLSTSSSMSESDLRSFDYLDTSQNACLLCQRKLKSLEILQRHERESALHRSNLDDLDACRAGVDRKLQQITTTLPGFTPIGSGSSTKDAAPKYRDRALERRAVFGTDPAPASAKGRTDKPRSFEGPAPVPRSEEPAVSVDREIGSDNIGSKMLAMMGWSKGQGLGSTGQGRTDIVETKIYAKRAGLGIARPSEAQQAQQTQGMGWKGYVSAAKDGARERYNGEQKE